jgi:DNA-binding IclR family transcriptional regulator
MLPQHVDRFLRGSLRSVWELELLLLLRAQRSRSWTADELVHDLRASMAIVGTALGTLQRLRLIERAADESYRYAPVTPELDQLVSDTAAAFASSPSSVTEAILSAPSSSIRIFADAFKIKKD